MDEKELVRRVIEFAFIIKAQLHSEETALMRSIMNILIMEAEEVIEEMDAGAPRKSKPETDQRWG